MFRRVLVTSGVLVAALVVNAPSAVHASDDGDALPAAVVTATSDEPAVLFRTSPAGYWLLGVDGGLDGFGAAKDVPASDPVPAVAVASALTGAWILRADGSVVATGGVPGLGGTDRRVLDPGDEVRAITARLDGTGYWVFTAHGRVIPYGSAVFLGDLRSVPLQAGIVGAAVTPSGNGYWMVAADGGVFAFGDAAFAGSMGGRPMNEPVVGMVADADGAGYWLVGADGGVFAFDAVFGGSLPGALGGRRPNRPVVAAATYGSGYAMAGADGGVFVFSDQPFVGAAPGAAAPPTVGIAVAPAGVLVAEPLVLTPRFPADGSGRLRQGLLVGVTLRDVGELPVGADWTTVELAPLTIEPVTLGIVSGWPEGAVRVGAIAPRSSASTTVPFSAGFRSGADVADPGAGPDFAWTDRGLPAIAARLVWSLDGVRGAGPWTAGPARWVDPACLAGTTPGPRTTVGPGGATYTVTPSGQVTVGGGGRFVGDFASGAPSSPVVGIAADPDGEGYWLLHRDHWVTAFGATWHGNPVPYDECGAARIAPSGAGYAVTLTNGTVQQLG